METKGTQIRPVSSRDSQAWRIGIQTALWTAVDEIPFDEAKSHTHFAPKCFNATWRLIDKVRTEEETLQMLDLAHASLWHWMQRPDGTPRNRSIGYWLLARVYALAGCPDISRRYGHLALLWAKDEEPFYRAFAFEALARAEMVAGNRAAMTERLNQAQSLGAQVTDPHDAGWLRENLDTIFLPD
jgi:hypothetical protein